MLLSRTLVVESLRRRNLNEPYNSGYAASDRDHFGKGNKFITPLIVNGKAFVGTPNGVAVFGVLN